MRLRPNVEWAQQALRKHWDTLTRSLPKTLLPRSANGQFEEYGAGHYGVVLPTSDPLWVFKLTTDPTEIFFGLVQNLPDSSFPKGYEEGVVHYAFVQRLEPNSETSDGLFVVVRNSVDGIGFLVDSTGILVPRSGANELYHFKNEVTLVKEFIEFATPEEKEEFQYASDRYISKLDRGEWDKSYLEQIAYSGEYGEETESGTFYTAAQSAAASHALAIYTIDCARNCRRPSDAVYDAIRAYADIGILLADVHGNNVGKVPEQVVEELDLRNGQWIISDPGHAMCLDDGWAKELKQVKQSKAGQVLVSTF